MTFINLISPVFAQQVPIPLEPPIGWEKIGNITVPGIVSTAVKLVLVIAALISFFFLIYGGISWILSGGDKEATGKAQKVITNALVGLIIVFAAWAIMRLIQTLFGIPVLDLNIPVIPG